MLFLDVESKKCSCRSSFWPNGLKIRRCNFNDIRKVFWNFRGDRLSIRWDMGIRIFLIITGASRCCSVLTAKMTVRVEVFIEWLEKSDSLSSIVLERCGESFVKIGWVLIEICVSEVSMLHGVLWCSTVSRRANGQIEFIDVFFDGKSV